MKILFFFARILSIIKNLIKKKEKILIILFFKMNIIKNVDYYPKQEELDFIDLD